MDRTDAKATVVETIEGQADLLLDVSHSIWDHPELCFDEVHAHQVLCDAIEGAGLNVERGAYDLPTAFRAEAGTEGPTIAVCLEYDALPGIGHACGHNVIAAAGLGAGLAAASLAEELGGRVVILGTPAEEGGGGKVLMIERGALEGVDAAMMVHPADEDLESFVAIAIQEITCWYHGRASHAAAAPSGGINALDGAVLGYMAVAALRQHIEAHERIHGIFTKGGGKPNIVPDLAEMLWYVRSGSTESLARLEPRVLAALESGAMASGSTFEFERTSPPYSNLVDNHHLVAAYVANLADRGRHPAPKETRPNFMGSTDMGNVSHEVPSIHPMIGVAPGGVSIHTPDFAEHARSERGDRAVIDGAIGMARTIVDLWSDSNLLDAVRDEFSHAPRSPVTG